MTSLDRVGESRSQLLRDAGLTVAAVLLAYAAFDDITTDNDTGFAFEWLCVGACAAWLLTVSWRLVRGEHRWLGSLSMIVLVVAVGAGSTIRRGSPFLVEYLVTMAALAWFLVLGGILAARAWRLPQHRAA